MVMDDDLQLKVAEVDKRNSIRYRKNMDESDFYSFIDMVKTAVQNGYPFGCVAGGGAFPRKAHYLPARACTYHGRCVWLDLSVIPETCSYKTWTVSEDVAYWSQVLSAGLPSLSIYCYGIKGASTSDETGCGIYRTGAVQDAAHKRLIAEFPDIVKPRPPRAWRFLDGHVVQGISTRVSKELRTKLLANVKDTYATPL
jgi:hypothetical protein